MVILIFILTNKSISQSQSSFATDTVKSNSNTIGPIMASGLRKKETAMDSFLKTATSSTSTSPSPIQTAMVCRLWKRAKSTASRARLDELPKSGN